MRMFMHQSMWIPSPPPPAHLGHTYDLNFRWEFLHPPPFILLPEFPPNPHPKGHMMSKSQQANKNITLKCSRPRAQSGLWEPCKNPPRLHGGSMGIHIDRCIIATQVLYLVFLQHGRLNHLYTVSHLQHGFIFLLLKVCPEIQHYHDCY